MVPRRLKCVQGKTRQPSGIDQSVPTSAGLCIEVQRRSETTWIFHAFVVAEGRPEHDGIQPAASERSRHTMSALPTEQLCLRGGQISDVLPPYHLERLLDAAKKLPIWREGTSCEKYGTMLSDAGPELRRLL